MSRSDGPAVVHFFLAPDLLSERSALRTTLRRKSYCVVTSLSAISSAASMTASRRDGWSPIAGSTSSTVSRNFRTALRAASWPALNGLEHFFGQVRRPGKGLLQLGCGTPLGSRAGASRRNLRGLLGSRAGASRRNLRGLLGSRAGASRRSPRGLLGSRAGASRRSLRTLRSGLSHGRSPYGWRADSKPIGGSAPGTRSRFSLGRADHVRPVPLVPAKVRIPQQRRRPPARRRRFRRSGPRPPARPLGQGRRRR